MFPATIPDLNDGTADHDYDTQYSEGRKVVRKDIASSLDQPTLLTISHSESGTGQKARLDSLLRFDRTVTDSEGNEDNIVVYLVIRDPIKVATQAQVLEVVKQLHDFLGTTTYAAQLINGEQ